MEIHIVNPGTIITETRDGEMLSVVTANWYRILFCYVWPFACEITVSRVVRTFGIYVIYTHTQMYMCIYINIYRSN